MVKGIWEERWDLGGDGEEGRGVAPQRVLRDMRWVDGVLFRRGGDLLLGGWARARGLGLRERERKQRKRKRQRERMGGDEGT